MRAHDIAFHLSVRDFREDGVVAIQIRDAFLNYASSDELKTSLKDLCRERLTQGVRSFVLDLTPVTVMDSCGLSVLISVKKMVGAEGGHVRLFGLSPMIRRLFAITKLEHVFDIREDEQSALTAPIPAVTEETPGAKL